jgi:pantothenate kinase
MDSKDNKRSVTITITESKEIAKLEGRLNIIEVRQIYTQTFKDNKIPDINKIVRTANEQHL